VTSNEFGFTSTVSLHLYGILFTVLAVSTCYLCFRGWAGSGMAPTGRSATADGIIWTGTWTAREWVGSCTAPPATSPRSGSATSCQDTEFNSATERTPASLPCTQAWHQGCLPRYRGT